MCANNCVHKVKQDGIEPTNAPLGRKSNAHDTQSGFWHQTEQF